MRLSRRIQEFLFENLNFQNIVTYENHGDYDQFGGELVCYFLPDGKSDVPEDWIMLQEDCSALLNGDDYITYGMVSIVKRHLQMNLIALTVV